MFSTSLCICFLFTILFCLSQQIEGFKVLALAPLVSNSHFSIGSSIVNSLRDAGHEITMISGFPRKEITPNYRDISIQDIRDRKLKGLKILIYSDLFESNERKNNNFCNIFQNKNLTHSSLRNFILHFRYLFSILWEMIWSTM